MLIGLGFLTKMWLIVPYAFALIAFCVVEAATVRSSGLSVGLRKSVIIGGAGFVVAALSHLVYIAFATPTELRVWLTSVYLGIFSGHGITGAKLSALADYARHERGSLYYPLVLYRDHFFLAPLCLYGVGELLRVPQARRNRLLAMIVGAFIARGRAVRAGVQRPALRAGDDAVLVRVRRLVHLGARALAREAAAGDGLGRAVQHAARVHRVRGGADRVPRGRTRRREPLVRHGARLRHAALSARGRAVDAHALRHARARDLGGVGLLAFAIAYPRVITCRRTLPSPMSSGPRSLTRHPRIRVSIARDADVLQGYLDRAGAGFQELANPSQAPQLTAYVFSPLDGRLTEGQACCLGWKLTHARSRASCRRPARAIASSSVTQNRYESNACPSVATCTVVQMQSQERPDAPLLTSKTRVFRNLFKNPSRIS